MNYIKSGIKDFYLLDSRFENIFINEYMPSAPGEYVKIYIYASMYAEHMRPMTDEIMAGQLGVTEEKVRSAWNYWEKLGAVKKDYIDTSGNYTIEFLSLREQLYGKEENAPEPDAAEAEIKPLAKESLKTLFNNVESYFGRTLKHQEIQEILYWNEELRMPPEVIVFCVKYCIAKDKYNFNYINKVIENWSVKKLDTVEAVQEHLGEIEQKYYRYERVMRALGFQHRRATEQEQKLMDKWFDEMGYNIDKVLEACKKTSGISNPNFNYVDAVLKNWKVEAEDDGRNVNDKQPIPKNILNRYYEFLREKAKNEAEEHKEEIYNKFPRIKEIDENIIHIGSELSKGLIMGTDSPEMRGLTEKMEKLTQERAVILAENNYEINYTDVHFLCDKCQDTGITDMGEKCTCILDRMEEARIWQKERQLKKGTH